MILDRFPEIQNLTPEEKLLFVSELWNEIQAQPPAGPVSQEILDELNRRMDRFKTHPEEFTTWESAKTRILARK